MKKLLLSLVILSVASVGAAPIKPEMAEALSKQVNFEHYSAYLYEAMANYFELANFKGFAHWMRHQSAEELKHAHKIEQFVVDREGSVVLPDVESPKQTWKSFAEAFAEAYAHEQLITQKINELADLAVKAADHATHHLMLDFAKEQVEEENNAEDNAQRVKMAGEDIGALFILDAELAKRGAVAK